MLQNTQLSFSDISEVYLQELRRGNPVKPELLANRFPQFADQILEQLPLMGMLEGGLRGASGLPGASASPPKLPEIPGIDLIEPIGRGATGVVYKAKYRSSNHWCAVKIIYLDAGNVDPLRLDREIESLTRLHHSNVAAIESFGTANDSLYIVMNFIDGCSLADIISGGSSVLATYWATELRNDWGRLASWGAEIASALDYIHQKGILHRDIKPANLLVDRTGRAWVTDFGLAKICESGMTLSRTGQCIGTPRYMAPEQMRGATDHRSDLYSLGRSLYELAKSGTDVKADDSTVEIPPLLDLNPRFPAELAKIIDKASHYQAEKRFQSAGELCAVFERYLAGLRPSDRRRAGKRMSEADYKKRMRSHPRIAIGMCLITVVTACTFFTTRNPSPEPLSQANAVADASPPRPHYKPLAAALESNEKGFVGAIGEAFKSSVGIMPDDSQANDVNLKIDRIVEKVSTEGLKPGELDAIMQGYRQSPLLIGNKILALSPAIRRSGLPEHEKARGQEILGSFAKATVNRHIETAEAERVLASLFQGNSPKLDSIVSMQVPDRVLSSWLTLVDSSFATEFRAIASEPSRVNDELNHIIDAYFQGSR